jgi:putative SOS response-associated peptidase YedK
MHIQLKGGQVFAVAGLWLAGKRGGVLSAAIVTTAPNELMATIHTRVPAILSSEDETAWLDPQLTDAQQVIALVKPRASTRKGPRPRTGSQATRSATTNSDPAPVHLCS